MNRLTVLAAALVLPLTLQGCLGLVAVGAIGATEIMGARVQHDHDMKKIEAELAQLRAQQAAVKQAPAVQPVEEDKFIEAERARRAALPKGVQ
jgi:hypothetical protein